jgi:hypothetical protein
MKPNSIKPAHPRRQSAAGVIRFQRIYPSSAPGRTCIVSDSGGHQSASGGTTSGSASGSASGPRNRPPSHRSSPSTPIPHFTHSPPRFPYPHPRRRYCSSCTYPSGITMKSASIKPAHRRQSAAGRIHLQRIYPSSAPGRTCIVSDSGGHRSASGGPAGGSAGGTPASLERPSPLNPSSSPPNQQFTSPSRIPCTPSRRRYCSSYTYPTGKGVIDDSIKPAHRRRQSTAGVNPPQGDKQRIYPSSASGRTCIVSDSGGHQSASGGPAGGSAGGTPASLERPSPLNPSSSPPNQQFTSPSRIPCTPSRRRYCSSYTYPSGNPRQYGILLIMRSKPNFQTNRLSVTLAMIRTYNDTCPKKHKKSKPIPNPFQTQSKPNANPMQTLSKPNQTQFPPQDPPRNSPKYPLFIFPTKSTPLFLCHVHFLSLNYILTEIQEMSNSD